MGPIKLRFLMQPAHWSQAERHEKITQETLDHFEKLVRPLSLQDADRGRSGTRLRGRRHGVSNVYYRRYELV